MNARSLLSVLFFVIFFPSITVNSQCLDPQFGVINYKDFKIVKCNLEDDADAVYIFEYGESELIYLYDNLYVRTKYHAKIKILTDEGVDEGNFEYSLYKNSDEEETFEKLKAFTYNKLSNGNIEKSELEKSQIFKEKTSSNLTSYKFTMPKIKKGSVLEVKYTKLSPFIFNFEPWVFQANIPKMKSEFTAIIPANFVYNVRLQGKLKLSYNEGIRLADSFIMGPYKSDASKIYYKMENIPSFIEERYITTSKNYISTIKYELELYKSFRGGETNYTKSWKDIEKRLLKDARFGDQFDVKVLKEEVNQLVSINTDQLELSKAIYDLVKTKMVFNNKFRLYTTKGGLKKALKNGGGNTSDVNLLLLNALLRAGIDADAVAISTRSNGFVNRKYPVLSEFNYVIVQIKIGDKKYLLDATRKNVPFGLLPFECYNIRGKIVKKDGGWVDLKTGDSFYENTMVSVALDNDLSFVAMVKNTYFNQSAVILRDKLDRFNSLDDYVENLEDKGDMLYDEFSINNRDDIDKGVGEQYTIEDTFGGFVKNDRIIFNPIIVNTIGKNPFKLKSRSYPIDYGLPTKLKTTYFISIPEGYELAKKYVPVKLVLPDNMGYYQYSLTETVDGKLLLRTSFVINSKVISTQDYSNIKSFYNSVINKNNSMIELKKIDLTAEKTTD